MSVVRRMTALATAIVAVLASGTAVTTVVPAQAVVENGATASLTLRVSSPGPSNNIIRVWRRDGDSVTEVEDVEVRGSMDTPGWWRITGVPHDVDLTVSSTPPIPFSTADPSGAETFLGDEPTVETADWFSVPAGTPHVVLPPLRMPRATEVAGTLQDLAGREWTGRPVSVRSWIRTPSGFVLGPAGQTRGGGHEDNTGTFTIRDLWPGAEVAVSIEPADAPVTSAAYAGGAASLASSPTVTTNPEFTVPVGVIRAPLKATWMTGRVVDSRGNPVLGAVVEQTPVPHIAGGYAARRTGPDGRYSTHLLWGDAARFAVTLDVNRGLYTWVGGGTSSDSAKVHAAQSGQAELELDEVTLQRPGAVVQARVVGDGVKPLGRSTVYVTWDGDGSVGVRTTTDTEGRYQVDGVPLGSTIRVVASEDQTWRRGAVSGVVVGDQGLVEVDDIVLRTGVTDRPVVVGTVHPTDPAFEFAGVTLVDLESGYERYFRWGPTDGMFVGVVPPGRYGLRTWVSRHRGSAPSVGSWWGGRRPSAGSPYLIEVGSTQIRDLGAIEVATSVLSGYVRDAAGAGLGGAVVTVTPDDGGTPTVRTTASNGAYSIDLPRGARVQVSVSRKVPGATYEPAVRGTAEQPVVLDDARHVEDFVLTPQWDARVGAAAGVRDEACLRNTMADARRELFLSTHSGVLGWEYELNDDYGDGPDLDWTDTTTPVVAIAPLEGIAAPTTWGRTDEGALCFLTVSPDATYQVWLAPRADGDSDVTINYDHVRTPRTATGGRVPLAAGWSDGRTPVILPGAGDSGDYDDDGRYALVRGSRGSSTPGQYRFRHVGFPAGVFLQNAEPAAIVGELQAGQVVTADPGGWTANGAPVDDVVFTYAWAGGHGDSSGPTRTLRRADGGRPLRLTVTAWYQGVAFEAVAGVTVDVEESAGPDPVVVSNTHGTYRGWPVVLVGETQLVTVHGCADVDDPTWTLDFSNGTPDLTGSMELGPMGDGGLRDYTFSLEDLPTSGAARIRTNVPETCEPGAPLIELQIYIDPAGSVTDQYGVPLTHATAMLFRADSEHGDYVKVPDGSDLMAPTNRANPVTTYGGTFRWDVAPGWYQVRAGNQDCRRSWSVPMEVPPARVALLIKLQCELRDVRMVPTTTVTGTPAIGSSLAASTTLSRPVPDQTVVRTEWMRSPTSQVIATGTTYTIRPEDAGRWLTVRQVVARAPYVPDDGRGTTTTFEEVVGEREVFVPSTPPPTSSPTPTPSPTTPPTPSATPTPTPTPSPTPSPTQGPAPTGTSSGRATSTTTLEVRTARASTHRAKAVVRVRAATDVVPTGVIEVRSRGKVVGRAVLRVRDRGRVVVRLTGLKRPGAHRLVASYLGSTGVEPSRSARRTVRIGAARPHPRVLHLEW